MDSIRPETNPDGSFKQIFNINDWKKKRDGYVTYSDLEFYASLASSNKFRGTLNTFQSIGFTSTLNNIDTSTFNYLANVNADIQQQFTDVYDYTIDQLALKRDLSNLDFDSINNVSRTQISYLENLSSDVQTSIDTINQVKRDLTDNIFDGELIIKSGDYGLSFIPAYNTSTAKTDNNAFSFTGLSNLYFNNTINASYVNSSTGAVLGSSTHLTRIRKNLNVDNVIRVGYNDATNVSGTQSNNAKVDINGSIYVKDNILVNGTNLLTYIDAQDQAIQSQITNIYNSQNFTELQDSVDDLILSKANISYVDAQIANVYNTSEQILQTIHDIQTELENDNSTEVSMLNSIGQKLNSSDYNVDKANFTTSINNINTTLTNYTHESDTNSTKINSDLSIDDKLIVNSINSNNILVDKLFVREIITPTPTSNTVLAYIFSNNRTYPIIQKYGSFNLFHNINFSNMEITLYAKFQFILYDSNNRVIDTIKNNSDDFIYCQALTVPPNTTPFKFVLKKII